MSGFIVFIIIVVAWAVFGSLKAAADKIGPQQERPLQKPLNEKKTPMYEPLNTPDRSMADASRRFQPNYNRMKMEDKQDDFGDKTQITVKEPSSEPSSSEIFAKPKRKNQEHHTDLSPLFKGDRLVESIILAECLDRPRAYRPHPLNKQQNMLTRRG